MLEGNLIDYMKVSLLNGSSCQGQKKKVVKLKSLGGLPHAV